MTAIRGILSVVCCCAAMLWAGACEEELTPVASRTPTTAPAEPVLREAETGPVKVTVTADRDRFVIPEQVRLVVRVEAEAGVEVSVQAFKDFAGPFAVADMAETEPDLELDELTGCSHYHNKAIETSERLQDWVCRHLYHSHKDK